MVLKVNNIYHIESYSNLTRIIEGLIEEGLSKKSSVKYIYRGQANANWPVLSGAERRLIKNGHKVERIDANMLLFYQQKEVLEPLKEHLQHHRGDFKDFGELENSSDLELLASIQHYEGATTLLDFSKKVDVASWFACQQVDENVCGAVYLLDMNDDRIIKKLTNDESKSSLEYIYANNYDRTKILIWEPNTSTINPRIYSQDSIFVMAEHDLLMKHLIKIQICSEHKKDIRKTLLGTSDINYYKLFNDLYGFANANSCDKPFNKDDLDEKFDKGIKS